MAPKTEKAKTRGKPMCSMGKPSRRQYNRPDCKEEVFKGWVKKTKQGGDIVCLGYDLPPIASSLTKGEGIGFQVVPDASLCLHCQWEGEMPEDSKCPKCGKMLSHWPEDLAEDLKHNPLEKPNKEGYSDSIFSEESWVSVPRITRLDEYCIYRVYDVSFFILLKFYALCGARMAAMLTLIRNNSRNKYRRFQIDLKTRNVIKAHLSSWWMKRYGKRKKIKEMTNNELLETDIYFTGDDKRCLKISSREIRKKPFLILLILLKYPQFTKRERRGPPLPMRKEVVEAVKFALCFNRLITEVINDYATVRGITDKHV
ncbi:MAG: hypothetical protein ABIJ56_17460, partial [Pseudomonadota bacterium]